MVESFTHVFFHSLNRCFLTFQTCSTMVTSSSFFMMIIIIINKLSKTSFFWKKWFVLNFDNFFYFSSQCTWCFLFGHFFSYLSCIYSCPFFVWMSQSFWHCRFILFLLRFIMFIMFSHHHVFEFGLFAIMTFTFFLYCFICSHLLLLLLLQLNFE